MRRQISIGGIRVKQARPTAQGIAGSVWCKVEMQVRCVVAEDVDVRLLGARSVPQYLRDTGQHRTKRVRLAPPQVGDERDAMTYVVHRTLRPGRRNTGLDHPVHPAAAE